MYRNNFTLYGIVTTLFILLTMLLFSHNTLAVGNTFPDDGDSKSGANTMAVAADTRYTESRTSRYRVWSKDQTRIELTIKNGNYCPASNPHDSRQSGDTGSIDVNNVTTFELVTVPIKVENAKYNKDCNNDIVMSGVPQNQEDKKNGYKYYIDFNVTQENKNPDTGVLNYYKLIVSGGKDSIITVRPSDRNGLGATIQQVNANPTYNDFEIKFRSCTAQNNKDINLYDIDNNIYGSGAQRGRYISVDLKKSGSFMAGYPKDLPKVDDQFWSTPSFNIEANKGYKFTVNDVYFNNVFQYSVPIDQLDTPCLEDKYCPPPNSTIVILPGENESKCPSPPVLSGYNWATTTISSVSSAGATATGTNYVVVSKNTPFTFTHDRNKAFTSSDDVATTGRWVDADIIANKSTVNFDDQWKVLDLGSGEKIDTTAISQTYNMNTPGVYCQEVKYPTTYTGGFTGEAKVINKTIATNGTHTADTGLESNDHFLDKNGTPKKTSDDYYYDKVRRYRYFPAGGDAGWRIGSTVKNPIGNPPNQIWWWYGGQQTSTDSATISANLWSSGPYNVSEYSTGQVCAYVYDAEPEAPENKDYEKGSADFSLQVGANANSGDVCLPTDINIVGTYNIGSPVNKSGNIALTLGPSTCNKSVGVSITLDDIQKNALNSLAPGTVVPYTVNIGGRPQAGQITVVEVPFARFYGNDVYATNGDIKFNSYTNNPSHTYDGRGSVAQYAALATGTHTIDTAAFRLNAAIPPIAPNGLDPNGSYLGNTGATKVYNEVVSKIPTNCGTTPSSYLLPSSSGCYRVSDDYRLTGIPRIGGSDGITCLDKQRINPLHTCGFPNNFEYITSNYDKKITLYNPDPNKPFMIVGDIVNTSASYSNPSSTGVMLIVSAGDIIIDNNVKRVDAILISNKGIHTCGWTWAPGYGSKVGQNQIDETCTSNLTINGSLSAKTIDFRRVGGSRYLNSAPGDEQQNCQISKGLRNCGDRGAMPLDTGKTAEIINFPAYLYWATPYLLDQAESGGTNEAMFVAPPRL